MNLHYLMNELYYQRRRTLAAIIGLSIGIALLIILNCPFRRLSPGGACTP